MKPAMLAIASVLVMATGFAHGSPTCPRSIGAVAERVYPLDSSPTFTVSLSFYNATTGNSTSVPSALTGWLFLNNTSAEEVQNFSVTDGAQYTYSNFTSLNLTSIGSVIVEGAEPTGYPNASSPLVDLSNLTNETSVSFTLNFTSAPSTNPLNPPPGGPVNWGGDLLAPVVELVGVGLFFAVVFVGVIGGKKLLSPIVGAEDLS